MSSRHVFTFAAVFVALLAIAAYQSRAALGQQPQLEALRQRAAQLAAESSALRRASETDARELAEAERQLAALPPLRAAAPGDSPERRTEIKAWLTRVRQLQRMFEAQPEQRIPEMQFLTDQDWLRVTKDSDFATDESRRKALAAARDAAAKRFLPQVREALRKFAQKSPNGVPDVFALAPFCDPPIASNLLERYDLTKTAETSPRWRVETKAPLDPDYDSRHYVDAYVDGRGYGGGSSAGPTAWIPNFREQTNRAFKAYAEANKGASAQSLAAALPYFNPPLTPALVEKLLRAERNSPR